MTRILVGVCTYNEAENIVELLQRIKATLPEADLLVIDDDSPDGTAGFVRQYASESRSLEQLDPQVAIVVRRDQRGLGTAIRAAMQRAIDGEYDLFCNLDADFSHDPADLAGLVEIMLTTPSIDVAVGSRYVDGGRIVGWPWYRRWMSRTINLFTRRVLRLPIRDASGSYRCYRVATLARALGAVEANDGYAFLQQILLELHRAGATCVEVPITFTNRVDGTSKLGVREVVRSTTSIVRLLKRR